MKYKLLAAVIMTSLIMGCETTPVQDGSATDATQGEQSMDATSGGLGSMGDSSGTALSGAQQAGVSYDRNAINAPGSVLAEKVIYFEYNSDAISDDYREVLAHHGKYLLQNTDMKVRLEGHADERGSREYNIALGNRRAQAVRSMMAAQGMNAKQLEVISYGEEKPVALSHDEAAWRLNRRVELVYEAK
ncbi:MAG: peptidoglycan-associated lipoprotein Pal [Gammaproteobacteria bacterium]|nr:peptidoglycan-associated lipoprotein Pal [Gammaproteobacteria bacterium]